MIYLHLGEWVSSMVFHLHAWDALFSNPFPLCLSIALCISPVYRITQPSPYHTTPFQLPSSKQTPPPLLRRLGAFDPWKKKSIRV